VWQFYDTDRDGLLDPHQIAAVYRQIGVASSMEDFPLQAWTLQEFSQAYALMKRRMSEHVDAEAKLRRGYRFMLSRIRSPPVDSSEFAHHLRTLGIPISDEDSLRLAEYMSQGGVDAFTEDDFVDYVQSYVRRSRADKRGPG
jgi:Ca2+-binding EF-hand superfamily protein